MHPQVSWLWELGRSLLIRAADDRGRGARDAAAGLPSERELSRRDPLEVELRDGAVVRIRLIDRGDRERLRQGFEGLSAESRYQRFFSPTPRLTESMLRRLIETDGVNRVAIGAEQVHPLPLRWLLPSDGVGVARFIRLSDRPDTAEIAVTIVDAWQGRGLGGVLIDALAWAASQRGVRRFVAYVQPDNERMKALLLHLDRDARGRMEDGLLVYEVVLDGIAHESLPPPSVGLAARIATKLRRGLSALRQPFERTAPGEA